MRRLSYMLLLAVTCVSCAEFYHPHFSQVRELMTTLDTLDSEITADRTYIDEHGGDSYLNLYSSGKVSVRLLGKDLSWVRLIGEETITGDGKLGVNMDANGSYRRMAEVEIALQGSDLKDTVRFYQHGIVPYMTCAEPFLTMDGTDVSSGSFALNTNLPADQIRSTMKYMGGRSGWVEYLVGEDGVVSVSAAASDCDDVTSALLTLSFPDGWKDKIEVVLRVTRSDADGNFGEPVSFGDLRSMATERGFVVEEDLLLEGLVISSCDSPNMELNPDLGYNNLDVLESQRTAYIQALDASCGFRLKFDDRRDNTLQPGTKLFMNLRGAVMTRENAPQRYTISSLSYENMLGMTADVPIPAKKKSIAGLKEDDIYTFVEIENTEFLNKAGSYANVKEEFSLSSSFNANTIKTQMDGWASLLVDADGNVIHAMVNMLCPWRRTGGGVPQGVGSVKGIIVHHDHRRYPDMGDYQIRVLDESGFCQAREQGSSFEELQLWGYYSDANPSRLPLSNDGTATLYLENPESPVAPKTCQSFNALDCSTKGIESGHAFRVQGDVSGWYRWDADGNVTDTLGVRLELSTESVTEGDLYVYVSMAANGQDSKPLTTFKNFPAHWCLKYSTDGEHYRIVPPVLDTGKPYVHLRSAPWTEVKIGADVYQTSAYCSMGFAEYLFALPEDALGQETLYVRLCPYDTVRYMLSKDWDAPVETGTVYPNTDNNNDIRFSAIRILLRK